MNRQVRGYKRFAPCLWAGRAFNRSRAKPSEDEPATSGLFENHRLGAGGGDGGIRTLGTELSVRRFSKPIPKREICRKNRINSGKPRISGSRRTRNQHEASHRKRAQKVAQRVRRYCSQRERWQFWDAPKRTTAGKTAIFRSGAFFSCAAILLVYRIMESAASAKSAGGAK
jgi:hypothetical protein